MRGAWQRQGRALAPVTADASPPAGADAVTVWRLSDGGHTFKGAAELRRTLSLPDLEALADCWSVPLRELNATGRALAEAPPPAPAVGETFRIGGQVQNVRIPVPTLAAVEATARRLGITKTELYLRAVADFLGRHG